MTLIALEEAFTIPALSARHPMVSQLDGVPVAPWFGHHVGPRLPDFTELRLADMDANGVDMQVLSLTAPGIQAGLTPDEAVTAAREANDFLAGVIAEHPSRFGGFAALPLQNPAAAVGELRRAVVDLGLSGALINDHTAGVYLDDSRYESLWSALEELDVPLYIHPGAPRLDAWRVVTGAPELVGPTWTWGAETGAHALRLLYGGVFDRHPEARVVLGHMGEYLPFMRSRLDSRYPTLEPGRAIDRAPSQYIGTNILITTSGVQSAAALRGAILEIGAEAIMFAIDYPWEFSDSATQNFAAAELSAEERELISHRNAERLLKLPPR
jgi:2,3-dihydroxybenzoate decarboxylase